MGKKISELRVVDLKQELEKRGVDTKGVKAALVERLVQALKNEGLLNTEYLPEEVESKKEEQEGSIPVGEGSQGVKEQQRPLSLQEELEEMNDEDAETEEDDEVPNNDTKEGEGIIMTENNKNDEEQDKVPKDDETQEGQGQQQGTDDNDALNISVEDEEEKFIMNGEDDTRSPTGEKGQEQENNNLTENRTEGEEGGNKDQEQEEGKNGESEMAEDTRFKPLTETNEDQSSEKTEEGEKIQQRKEGSGERHTLLVTGLTSATSATEVKTLFKKHGKIGGVKIMSSSKDPDGSRFALVAVMIAEDADNCIRMLDGFALHGRIIHVDKAQADMLSADWLKKGNKKEKSTAPATSTSNPSTPNVPDTTESEKPNSEDTQAVAVATSAEDQSPNGESEKEKKPDDDKKEPASQASCTTKPKAATDATSSGGDSAAKLVKKEPVTPSTTTEKPSPARPSTKESYNNRSGRDSTRDIVPGPRNPRHVIRKRGGSPGRRVRSPSPLRRFRDDFRDRRSRIDRGRDRHFVQHRVPRRPYSPVERIPFRRHSPGAGGRDRYGRQPELTFEDIYDIRQKEKEHQRERERREADRRRIEEEEKQRLLDEEFRRLARERERIDAEKAELKRQKERMLIEERERQKREQEEIEREKALLARKVATKRLLHDEEYSRVDAKKILLDDRDRSRPSGYMDSSSRGEKDKSSRSHSYRDADYSRYADTGSSARGAVPREPVRDQRVSPNWDKESRRSTRDPRGNDRSKNDRDRSRGTGQSKREDRRDESKSYSAVTGVPELSARYNLGVAPSSDFSSMLASQGRLDTSSKQLDVLFGGSSGSQDRVRWAGSTSAFPTDSTLSLRSSDNWSSTRDPTWSSPAERLGTRSLDITGDRWAASTSSTRGMPVAPPPPIFSSVRPSDELNLSSLSSTSSSLRTGSSLYSAPYDYKYPPLSSQRR